MNWRIYSMHVEITHYKQEKTNAKSGVELDSQIKRQAQSEKLLEQSFLLMQITFSYSTTSSPL